MSASPYRTPAAFKQALEARLRAAATQSHLPMSRLRQRLLFERFLVRVFALLGDAVLLKGGVVLELRLSRARATRDVDLRCTGRPEDLLARLQEAGRSRMEDLLLFEVGDEPRGHTIQGESMVYEGHRFRAQARLDGRPYGEPFGVDVAFGDVWEAPYQRMARDDGLPWTTLEGAHRAASAFVEPVLSGNAEVWNPGLQVWQARGATGQA